MANRRMICKSISVSTQVNKMSLFSQLLYTWMIPHADDWGRMDADPGVIWALVVPRYRELKLLPIGSEKAAVSEELINAALAEMAASVDEAGQSLILLYEVGGKRYLQYSNWDKDQAGLHKRIQSDFPAPPAENVKSKPLDASDEDIEDWIISEIQSKHITIADMHPDLIERQLRIGNCYLDVVIRTNCGDVALLELKRQRLTNSAISQILKYRELLGVKNTTCVLIGYGLAANFDLLLCSKESIAVITYDDSLQLTEHTLPAVISCHLTSNNVGDVIPCYPLREENRTEGKGTDHHHDVESQDDDDDDSIRSECFTLLEKLVPPHNRREHHYQQLQEFIADHGPPVVLNELKDMQARNIVCNGVLPYLRKALSSKAQEKLTTGGNGDGIDYEAYNRP